jgi:hypothetical protein
MQLFRHLGLMIAVFWCAAMVVAPMAAATGAGQDMSHSPQGMGPGQSGPGTAQMQQGSGQGSGNTAGSAQQGNQGNNAGPGQGGQFPGMTRGNMTGMNMTGMNWTNMTPPERPDWDPDNSTAMNTTGMHGRWSGNGTPFNMTDGNMTGFPPHGNWDPANMTAANQSWHGYDDGNMTPPQEPARQGAGNGQGPQAQQGGGQGQQFQANSQDTAGNSLISELVDWLKAHGIS